MSKPSVIVSKIQKMKEFQSLNSNPSQKVCNFINIPLGSVFVKKFSHKKKIPNDLTEQSDNQQIDQVQQNQLSKFKHYSRILQSSTKLSKFHFRQNNSSKSQDKNSLKQQSESLQKLNEKQNKQFELIQNYYTSKNQRKNKVLNKAKELGKNNFYKFLKQTAILENNRHFHRFHDQAKATRKGSLPQQVELSSGKEQISPIIFSFKPVKDESMIQKMLNKLQQPGSVSIRQIKKKLRLKTESTTQYRSLGITTQNSEADLSSPQKRRNNKKCIIRSLTEINQQLRKNRNSQNKDQLLFKDQESSKIQNLQNFVQKWKYKSLLNSQIQLFDRHLQTKNPTNIFKQQLKELERPKKSLFFSKQKQLQCRGKSQIIRNTSFKKSILKKQTVQALSFNVKSLMPQIKPK